MFKRTTAVLFLLMLSGCGGNSAPSPAAPTPTPTPTTFTLLGQVFDSDTAQGVSGATVTVVDGANAGRSGNTDGSGKYTIAALQPGGFTARARAPDYTEFSQGVTLASNQAVNFSLALIPAFSKSGTGSARFDMPMTVQRVRIQAAYQGNDDQDFVVDIHGSEVINVTLGTSYIASGNSYASTQSATPPGGPIQIVTSASVSWSLTEVR